MSVEAPGLIKDFNPAWPTDDDYKVEGDNHIRLVKGNLQAQFPNLEAAMNRTAAELETLSGIQTGGQTIEQRLAALEAQTAIPAGTVMVFLQASAPTGWTFSATLNDMVLRVTSTEANGGTTGGSWTISGLTSPSHQHSVNTDGAHVHDRGASGGGFEEGAGGRDYFTDSQGNHNHGGLVGGTAVTIASDGSWRPAYVDVIACTKDA